MKVSNTFLRTRCTVLPSMRFSEIASSTDNMSQKITIGDSEYLVKPKQKNVFTYEGMHKKIIEKNISVSVNLYPIVVDKDHKIWVEANLYIYEKFKNNPNVVSLRVVGQDLAHFDNFLKEANLSWNSDLSEKLRRPTYRYRAYLNMYIANGGAESTAKRRMGNVIAFYKWVKSKLNIKFKYPLWVERNGYFPIFSNAKKRAILKQISSTDLSRKASNSVDPYTKEIVDEGRLTPLTKLEQELLIKTLREIGNTEMYLVHLIGLACGARLQSILTCRIKHFKEEITESDIRSIRIAAGNGTEIDTKNSKKITLHIPLWLYEKIRTYLYSNRAQERYIKSSLGFCDNQYLFLTNRGNSYYESNSDLNDYSENFNLKYNRNGQTLRMYIRDTVIPKINSINGFNKFNYKFHDLRASFGMNITDYQLNRVSKGEITLHEAREYVKGLMNHESSQTTDLYLNYRSKLNIINEISSSYFDYLENTVNDKDF